MYIRPSPLWPAGTVNHGEEIIIRQYKWRNKWWSQTNAWKQGITAIDNGSTAINGIHIIHRSTDKQMNIEITVNWVHKRTRLIDCPHKDFLCLTLSNHQRINRVRKRLWNHSCTHPGKKIKNFKLLTFRSYWGEQNLTFSPLSDALFQKKRQRIQKARKNFLAFWCIGTFEWYKSAHSFAPHLRPQNCKAVYAIAKYYGFRYYLQCEEYKILVGIQRQR